MENNNQNGQGASPISFGVTTETKSSNITPFKGGLHKGLLKEVKVEEIGKKDKYIVLSFLFTDFENIKTFKKSEFMVDQNDDKFEVKLNGFNSRIKHIWEAYAPFPTTGIGVGATDWKQYFEKIAESFNKGNNGQPIFKKVEGDKSSLIPVWLKLTYRPNDGKLDFPLSPNFIERLKETNISEPSTLIIDNNYDITVQPEGKKKGNVMGGNRVVGGAGNNSATDFDEFN